MTIVIDCSCIVATSYSLPIKRVIQTPPKDKNPIVPSELHVHIKVKGQYCWCRRATLLLLKLHTASAIHLLHPTHSNLYASGGPEQAAVAGPGQRANPAAFKAATASTASAWTFAG
jgi:hypothetical protein